MKIKITGYRGSEEKTVIVDVIRPARQGWLVTHTDGKPAVVIPGSGYSRMSSSRYVTLLTDCHVEKLSNYFYKST